MIDDGYQKRQQDSDLLHRGSNGDHARASHAPAQTAGIPRSSAAREASSRRTPARAVAPLHLHLHPRPSHRHPPSFPTRPNRPPSAVPAAAVVMEHRQALAPHPSLSPPASSWNGVGNQTVRPPGSKKGKETMIWHHLSRPLAWTATGNK